MFNLQEMTDTKDWVNGDGYGCASYASRWCENGGAKEGQEWTLGQRYNYPENNCCVCGKDQPIGIVKPDTDQSDICTTFDV